MMKALFVCLGNICRSPLAEAIFNKKIKQKGLGKEFQAFSCGTADYHIGQPPDPRTLRNAAKNGIDIQHLGRQLSPSDLENFDLIIPMDKSNFDAIIRLGNTSLQINKIVLIREYDPMGKGDVPDPWFGGERGFQEVFEMLDRSIDGLIAHLIKEPG